MAIWKKYLVCFITMFSTAVISYAAGESGMISGKVLSLDGEPVDYATVFLKGTTLSCSTNEKGLYHISAPAGDYTIVFSSVGFEKHEAKVRIKSYERAKLNVKLKPANQLAEVIVVGNPLSKVKNSAYNATAVSTKELVNTTKTLSEALNKAPGMKIRESGGVGSDMAVTMDGFSGKHVKVFIDGVPQEGVGSSFGLNNIPVNFADRIEVYRGVVPVGFGADAIGGVINIVTPRRQRRWFVDASYSFGSFNTHKSYVNFGKVATKGISVSVRYNFSRWLSLGGNFTQMNVRDNMKTAQGSTVANLAYKERMPNLPYMFADSDVNFYWHSLGRKGNVLTVTYDNQYTHSFCYYVANIGSNNNDYMIPNQFAHNLTVSYGIQKGRYNLYWKPTFIPFAKARKRIETIFSQLTDQFFASGTTRK